MSKANQKKRKGNTPPHEIKEPSGDLAIQFSQERWPWEPYIMLGLLAAVAIVVFRGYLFFQKAYLFKDIGSDSINIFYPGLVHVLDYLHSDGLPKWSFNQGMGQNIFPGTGDIFIPVFYLFGRNNVGFALAYVEVFKILIGGMFFYFFLRKLEVSPVAALTGGLLFGFSGYMILGGGWYMFSYDAMCGAILLFGFEKLFKDHVLWILPIPFVLLGASQAFDLYLYGVLLFVYSTLRFLEDRQWSLQTYVRLILTVTGLALLGAAISGVFLFENIAQLLQSPRGAGDASLFKSLASMPVLALGSALELSSVALRLFSSDLQGSGSDFVGWTNYLESPLLYCGLIALVAAPQFLVSLDPRKRKVYVTFAAACVIALIVPYLRYAFWAFSGNYYRTFSFFISLTILYLGVRGISLIDRTSCVRLATLAVSLGIVLGLLFLPPYGKYVRVNDDLRGIIALLLCAHAALLALLGTPRARRLAQVLILATVCFEAAFLSDLTVNHRVTVSADELSRRVGYNDMTVDAVKYIHSVDSGFYRVNKDYSSGPAIHVSLNDAKVQNYYGSASYSGFNQLYYVKFLEGMGLVHPGKAEDRWTTGLTSRPVLQVLGSVKYAFTRDPLQYQDALWEPVKTVGDVHVFKNRLFVPLGAGYDTVVPQSEFLRYSPELRDQILTKAVVIDDADLEEYKGFTRLNTLGLSSVITIAGFRQDIGLLQTSSMQMSEHHQNLIRGTIDAKAKKLLFLSIPYDKGWSATVDGKPAEIKLVDFGLMGLMLEPGKHTIELKFRPRFLFMGAGVSVASSAGYAMLFLVPVWLRRRSADNSSASSVQYSLSPLSK